MYLPSKFLISILETYGLFKEGDSLYVSNECGCTKADGSLYRYVKEKEKIDYRNWYHFGDNRYSDIQVPQRLGIHTTYVDHTYSPYSKEWKKTVCLQYNYPSILSGLSHCLRHNLPDLPHKDFTLDIIAPFYLSFVCRILKDAQEKGLQRLFFCARDAYHLFHIAQKITPYYGDIDIQYLYISRKALYEETEENIIEYFRSINLATLNDQVGIVDIRSSGKTASTILELLRKNKYNTVHFYYFEFGYDIPFSLSTHLNSEINSKYDKLIHKTRYTNHWMMYEMFFSINMELRTIGYSHAKPIFDNTSSNEYTIYNKEKIVQARIQILDSYASMFTELHLHEYADEIFNFYAIPQLNSFFEHSNKHYLKPLAKFIPRLDDGTYTPYIQKNTFMLPFWFTSLNKIVHTRCPVWKRGTLFYSLPTHLAEFIYGEKFARIVAYKLFKR